ncbi:MAG TPA: hypothetical protein VH325_15825 [Bryobacteraceae bacterium]|jgi:hypothetical protein|nr:hypothetical protein [Bryobacteraceae bacterium]
MDHRREFLKQAGLLTLNSWAAISKPVQEQSGDVVIENAEMRLVIASTGAARRLIHKASGQECLAQTSGIPVFTVTQYRPYDNELQLSYPAKPKTFPAESVRREGNRLLVSFALVGYEAVIQLRITEAYIGFTLESLEYKGYTSLRSKKKTPIDESVFLQLPVRNRKNFGEWLNVMWDEHVAVTVLGTDPYARVDASACGDYRVMQVGTVDSVKTAGVGGALVVTATRQLLDRVGKIEKDYDLPRGVESRRGKEYNASYYELLATRPEDIDRHIRFARMAGLRYMDVYYRAFAKTAGHFDWRPEYPNGMADVKRLTDRITQAGLVPGIHIHYNKADKEDGYVTPRPDPRLSVTANFTVRAALDDSSKTITIEESPRQCTLDEGRRILKIQDELISYERYTTDPPYQFLGCQRGALGSKASSYPAGTRLGLLDVDTWPIFVRFTQDTDIQEEVAQRLAEIYRGAGFKFVYFDGAEDVPGPDYWYTVSRAQWLVYKRFDPKPLFSEGACKSHFSWHILTRGNAFDVFKPEVSKAAIRAYPAAEAPQAAKDFTSINFGWIGYWSPGRQTIGTQPDMMEYATSRAAGWDCPVSLVGDLEQFDLHQRTPDNLEVLKRWEDVRAKGWLTETQKAALRNLDQEHTLLIDEQGAFELAPYTQIERVAGQNAPARAFVFQRKGKVYVAFWHTSGTASLAIPLQAHAVQLMAELGKPRTVTQSAGGIVLPLAGRMYLEFEGVPRDKVIAAFQNAKILAG